jgi:tRNA(fMet)-specific endonuclease VapC
MILLDTDHLSVFADPRDANQDRLRTRLDAASDQVIFTSSVSVEERFGGWITFINRQKDVHQQVLGYEKLVDLIGFFTPWQIQPFDMRAADTFKQLRKQKVRIGSMDLKIASIALVNDALLLSANLRDFRQVPGLRVEDWLAPQSEPPASDGGGQATPTS